MAVQIWKHRRPGRQHTCSTMVGGAPCGLNFTRAANLLRHVREQHGQSKRGRASTFVIQSSGVAAVNVGTPPAVSLPPLMPTVPEALATHAAALPAPSALFPDLGRVSRERDPRDTDYLGVEGLLGRARFRDVMPAYDAVVSKKYPGQIRGIRWLSQGGKDHLEGHVSRLMASWGLGTSHSGTCVIWPEDWRALEPEALASLLEFKNCPLVSSSRAMYRYDDHMTTLARAIAWFKDWPRTGAQLDAFLESGPYQRQDGSHRCHNPLCVNPSHLVYEPASCNIHRQGCRERASFLRTHGRDIPPECHLHNPPCLMQHASLTTFEACTIQVSVLRQARGFPQAPPARPPWHRYPTFESQLPSSLEAIRAEPLDLVTQRQGGSHRPTLICQLCSRIKGFGRVASLWGHVWTKHADRSEEERIGEVRRTAALWESYMETTRSNKSDPIIAKLADISRGSFSWKVVETWFT